MKKAFNTPVDAELADRVREKCRNDDIRITDMLEALMTMYVNDEIKISKKVTYEINLKDNK